MEFAFIVGGLVGLLFGGEWLVRGAVGVAERARISPLVIGLTLVGFGTSSPELFTSLQAAARGSPGIAVGNVVGSNIANILLILGVAALIAPVAVRRRGFIRDGSAMMLATVVLVALSLTGVLSRPAGIALLAGLIVYLVVTLRSAREDDVETPVSGEGATDGWPWRSIGFFGAGLVVTLISAGLLVDGAVTLAASLGVSETVIGLTIVAVGTSLPELVTSTLAARKGQSDLALGNVVGSNIFNIFGILGTTALVLPVEIPPAIIRTDIWVMLAANLALVAMAVTGWRISRREGGCLVAAYVGYTVWLIVQA